MYRIFCLLSSLLFGYISYAQGVTIGSNNPPHPSAILDVQGINGGFLLPQLTTIQRNALSNPANGLQILNTTTQCIEVYFSNGGWRNLSCNCSSFPNPSFTFNPSSISIGVPVTFTPNLLPGASYAWTFASGSVLTSNAASPSVSWANPGTYQVNLVVTDALGCSDSSTQNITVNNCPPGSTTFTYSGSVQSFIVPNCATQVTIEAWGAQGGNGNDGNTGGLGGYARGTLQVTPVETLSVYVGQAGAGNNGSCSQTTGTRYNGGGQGNCAASGGGASDVRRGGTALSNRVIVAGGGGGCGFYTTNGGAGGGTVGANGQTHPSAGSQAQAGQGGTQSAGGPGGSLSGTSGSLGVGGNGGTTYGGGGGGGYYGGGGGGGQSGGNGWGGSGGGGSSFTGTLTNSSTQSGIRSGNGQVIISW